MTEQSKVVADGNRITNKKVDVLRYLPKTTLQIDGDDVDTHSVMSLAEYYGAVYWVLRRQWKAERAAARTNQHIGSYEMTHKYKAFRLGRRVIVIDRDKCPQLADIKIKRQALSYRSEGPPGGFLGALPTSEHPYREQEGNPHLSATIRNPFASISLDSFDACEDEEEYYE